MPELSDRELLQLIPTQSGLYFVGCVHCQGGQQEGQLSVWDVAEPQRVRCAFCGHAYPSGEHPMDDVLEVEAPDGRLHRYPYHASQPAWWSGDEPYRSYFAARIDYHRIRYMEDLAVRLARAHRRHGDAASGRRAALILHRFAQVFPGYCYHYDFPFQQKIIHAGSVPAHSFRKDFRTARWTWWAYLDLSTPLLEAYALIAQTDQLQRLSMATGTPVAADIHRMLTSMADQVLDNEDRLGNMSPGMWAALIQAGRVLQRPGYVHTAVERLRRMLTQQFFADGSWQEGAPSYHSQVMGGLEAVMAAAHGYADPPGYTHPRTGERFDDLDLRVDLPTVARAARALGDMRLPDGRYAPVHDTWARDAGSALEHSRSLLLPALGHGILGHGSGAAQTQVHLSWSPGYGHIHYDGLSLLLFARGSELLSDIGYTHTRWREWTVTSAAHNLVVVDGANQAADSDTHGHLRFFDAGDPSCQVLSVDNPQVYGGIVETYRRTLALVASASGCDYVIDVFRVDGGSQHDYFLHGSADALQTLEARACAAPLRLQPLESLVPEGVGFHPGRTEQTNHCLAPHFAYGYLRNLRRSRFTRTQVVQLDFGGDAGGCGVRAWCVVHPGDELVLGTNPAIRQAGSDDDRLEDYHRAFAMLRRRASTSRFVSIIAPHAGTPCPQSVRLVELAGTALALEITTSQRRDLLLIDAHHAHGTWLGRPLTATTELALLQHAHLGRDTDTLQATVVAGMLRWGGEEVDAGKVAVHTLLAVERGPRVSCGASISGVGSGDQHGVVSVGGREQEGAASADREEDAESSGRGCGTSLLLKGTLLPPRGTFVTVDHAGERTSVCEVVDAVALGDHSRLWLAADPGFEFQADTQTSRFLCLPLSVHTGPHLVRLCPVGRAAGGPARAR